MNSIWPVTEETCAEPITPGSSDNFGIMPLSAVSTANLQILRDRKKHVPSAQINRVKAIKALFKWALAEKKIPTNPARDLVVDAAPAGGHHSWTADEVRQFEERHPIGTKARLALALLLWTGVRRSDLVKLGKQHVRNGWLRFTQQKNRNRRPVQVAVPILPELQAVIDASPTGNLTFLMTKAGAPYTLWGFGNWFRDRCIEGWCTGPSPRSAQGRCRHGGREQRHDQAAHGDIRLAERRGSRALYAGSRAQENGWRCDGAPYREASAMMGHSQNKTSPPRIGGENQQKNLLKSTLQKSFGGPGRAADIEPGQGLKAKLDTFSSH
jgi:integrase